MNWIKCSDRMPEINVESIEMSEPFLQADAMRTARAAIAKAGDKL